VFIDDNFLQMGGKQKAVNVIANTENSSEPEWARADTSLQRPVACVLVIIASEKLFSDVQFSLSSVNSVLNGLF